MDDDDEEESSADKAFISKRLQQERGTNRRSNVSSVRNLGTRVLSARSSAIMAMAEVVVATERWRPRPAWSSWKRRPSRGGRGFGAGRHNNNNQRGDFKKPPQSDGGLKCALDAKGLAIRFRSALPMRRSI